MKVSKPSAECLKLVSAFVNACEGVLEKEKFGFKSAYEQWHDWDDDDEDKKLMLRIRKSLSVNEEVEESEIDERILAYEFLKVKYTNRLKHADFTLNVLMDNCVDPQEDCLEFHPTIYHNHVAPEQ